MSSMTSERRRSSVVIQSLWARTTRLFGSMDEAARSSAGLVNQDLRPTGSETPRLKRHQKVEEQTHRMKKHVNSVDLLERLVH